MRSWLCPSPRFPVTSDKEDAPTVTVELPSNTSAKVEIPVSDVTAGTVAILVKADGTEEIIKTPLTTENGVAVTLADGDTVKIMDNSKDFDDVASNYWGNQYINFATSRELFSGTSATAFAPETVMTRSMIVTVLASYDGANTAASSGEPWYAASQQWAMENGTIVPLHRPQSCRCAILRQLPTVGGWRFCAFGTKVPQSAVSPMIQQ